MHSNLIDRPEMVQANSTKNFYRQMLPMMEQMLQIISLCWKRMNEFPSLTGQWFATILFFFNALISLRVHLMSLEVLWVIRMKHDTLAFRANLFYIFSNWKYSLAKMTFNIWLKHLKGAEKKHIRTHAHAAKRTITQKRIKHIIICFVIVSLLNWQQRQPHGWNDQIHLTTINSI